MYESGIGKIDIIHRAAKHNSHAKARQPVLSAPIEGPSEMQVALITSKDDDVTITTLPVHARHQR